jgi:hypothetical protein
MRTVRLAGVAFIDAIVSVRTPPLGHQGNKDNKMPICFLHTHAGHLLLARNDAKLSHRKETQMWHQHPSVRKTSASPGRPSPKVSITKSNKKNRRLNASEVMRVKENNEGEVKVPCVVVQGQHPQFFEYDTL